MHRPSLSSHSHSFLPPRPARMLAGRGALALTAAAAATLLSACGGGGKDEQSGGNAPAPQPQSRLCPAALDYTTTFTGGSGSGELVKLQIDTTAKTWTVTFLHSSVPQQTGTVLPTRDDPTDGKNVMTGKLTQETALPTEKQNQCAFRLEGASLDPARPARLFVGDGVVGGTIPGARIQFDGIMTAGAVPDTTFPYFQFIGFAQTETDLAKIAGQYNGVGYHVVPSKRFQPVAQDFRMTLAADGSFTVCDTASGQCGPKGDNFAPQASGALLSTHYKAEIQPPTMGETRGRAYLIVGKLRGQLVPILIRAGYAHDLTPDGNPPGADDEIGIGMLAPVATIAPGSVNGQYVGVDSNFDYRATALRDGDAAMLDPFRPSDASLATAYKLDYAQAMPGIVTTTRKEAAPGSPPTGKFIFAGGVFGVLEARASGPYFSIGAFVQ